MFLDYYVILKNFINICNDTSFCFYRNYLLSYFISSPLYVSLHCNVILFNVHLSFE